MSFALTAISGLRARFCWRRAVLPALGILVTGICTVAFVAVQRRAELARYETACDNRTLAIQRHLETNLALLRALQAFAGANRHDWGTMHRFVASFAAPGKDIVRYYWWNPEISTQQVQPLEAYAEVSCPVEFKAAMRRLVETATMSESGITMVLAGQRATCLTGLAVDHAGGAGKEQVILAFDVAALIEDALSVIEPTGINLELNDASGRLLYRHAARLQRTASLSRLFQPNPSRWARTAPLNLPGNFAGAGWQIRYTPIEAYLPAFDTLTSCGVLFCGLLITLLLDRIWERRRRQSLAAQELAAHRTRQLRETESQLREEIRGKEDAVASWRNSEDRFQRAYRNSMIGMVVMDRGGKLLQVNQATCRFFGCEETELIGRPLLGLVDDGDQEDVREKMRQLSSGQIASYVAQRRFHRADGGEIWLRSRVCHMDQGEHLLAIVEDVSDSVEAQRQLEFQATHDGLTGLLNRRAFEDVLTRAVADAKSAGSAIVLMYLDLDGFKFVNDSLGHSIGDLLLPAVGERLRGCLDPSDTLARVGGDEFTIIVEQPLNRKTASSLAERLLACLEAPFVVKGYELFVSASIGICRYPEDGETPIELVQHADTAMYQAKRGGKGSYSFFTAELAAAAQARLEMERDLRHAMERGEFEVHFQPLVRPAAGSLVSFEALCRWRHPVQGYIPPERFIPVAEDTGLIIPIGEWVMQEACRQALRWNALLSPVRVAVNVSLVQLTQARFVEEVAGILHQTGLPPHLLELELTESAVMQNAENAARMLRELRELGVSIALDDFGTGYSSLSRLRLMPLDTLKIDRSFVSDLTHMQTSQSLVASLISLAHGIGLRVVSEGVESPEQAEILHGLGCDVVQGFYFGKALQPQDAFRFVEAATAGRAALDLASLAKAVKGQREPASVSPLTK